MITDHVKFMVLFIYHFSHLSFLFMGHKHFKRHPDGTREEKNSYRLPHTMYISTGWNETLCWAERLRHYKASDFITSSEHYRSVSKIAHSFLAPWYQYDGYCNMY